MFFWQDAPQASLLQDVAGGIPAAGFAVGSPVIGAPSLAQNHVLGASGFAVASPVIGNAALASGANDVATAAGFAVGSPVIGSASVNVNHVLAGSGFAVGSPSIGSPSLAQAHVISANGFAVSSPVIGNASFPGAAAPEISLILPSGGGSGWSYPREREKYKVEAKAAEATAVEPTTDSEPAREAARQIAVETQEYISQVRDIIEAANAGIEMTRADMKREVERFLRDEEEIALLLLA